MTLRERILVGLAIAAALGAAVYVLLPTAETVVAEEADGLGGLLDVMDMQLQQLDLSEQEQRILALMNEPLDASGLRPPPEAKGEPGENAVVMPRYTGYVRIGERELGIVDGREYREGEMLRDRPLRVVSLDGEKVILAEEGKDGATVEIELEQEN